MPSCKAGCVFGCWQLTGCRETLLSLILSFLGPDAVLRCPRAPPPSPPRSPKHHPPVLMASPTPSVLSRHPAADTQLRFRCCTSPRRYCIAFPLLGRHPCSISFHRRDVHVFVCKQRRVRPKMSIYKPSKPSSCFNSSEPCTADGMVPKSSAVSKAWRGVLQELLTASRQPASSIMLSTLNRQWVQGSSKRLVKESGVDVHHSIQIPTLWTCGCAHRGHE